MKILILGRALLPSIPSLGNLPPEVYKNIEDSYKTDETVRFPVGMLIPGAPYSGRRYFALAFALAKIADVKFYGPGYPNYMESWLPTYGEIDVLDVIRRLYPNDYPDVVMQLSPCNAEGMISSFSNFEKVQCLRVLWAADFHNDVSEPTIQKQLAEHVWDLIIKSWDVNNLTQYSQRMVQLGIPMEWVPFSIDPDVFKDYELPKIYDVINMGSFNSSYYPLRVAMHEALVAHRDKIKYVCGYDFLTESNRVAGVMTDEYARIINQGKLYTTCTSTFKYPGLKLFEIMGCNTLLISDTPYDADELGLKAGENYVQAGTDVWSQFNGQKDYPLNLENWLCDKDKFFALVSHYLTHSDEALRISKNGYNLVHSRHTNDIRSKEFLQILQRHGK